MASYTDSVDSSIRYGGDIGGDSYSITDATLNISSDTTLSNLSTDLASVCTGAGLSYRNLATNADLSSFTQSSNILYFGANGDIDDRIIFMTGNNAVGAKLYQFNNSGSTLTTTVNNSADATNLTNQTRKLRADWDTAQPVLMAWNVSNPTIYCAVFCDGQSLGILTYGVVANTNVITASNTVYVIESRFFYAGKVTSPHASLDTTGKQYVSILSNCTWSTGSGTTVNFETYRGNRCQIGNELFVNTTETYPTFTCTGGSPTPTKQWVKPLAIYNGGTLMGYARGLLMGIGSFPTYYPTKIVGTGGEETWIPVCNYGTFGNEQIKILMRCKSTTAKTN